MLGFQLSITRLTKSLFLVCVHEWLDRAEAEKGREGKECDSGRRAGKDQGPRRGLSKVVAGLRQGYVGLGLS